MVQWLRTLHSQCRGPGFHHWLEKRIPYIPQLRASQVALAGENQPANAGDTETRIQSLGQEDFPEESMATHFCILSGLKNPMDRGALQATVHGIAKSCTRLK